MKPGKMKLYIIHRIIKESIFKVIILVICYFIISILLFQDITSTMNGILAQGQVMIAIFLVISNLKYGYKISIILTLFTFISEGLAMITNENYNSISGMIIAAYTTIICTIIFTYNLRLIKHLQETKEKNEMLKEKEDQLKELAFFDALTEIPNRNMLMNRLDFLCDVFEKRNIRFAVVFIDLDNFKKINDTIGHLLGDSILKVVASQIKDLVHPLDMIARLGGDEFALIIERELAEEELFNYVDSLRLVLLKPVVVDEIEINISASFGVANFPKDGRTTYELLQYSDIAMYQAKKEGKNGVQIFKKSMNDKIKSKEQERREIYDLE